MHAWAPTRLNQWANWKNEWEKKWKMWQRNCVVWRWGENLISESQQNSNINLFTGFRNAKSLTILTMTTTNSDAHSIHSGSEDSFLRKFEKWRKCAQHRCCRCYSVGGIANTERPSRSIRIHARMSFASQGWHDSRIEYWTRLNGCKRQDRREWFCVNYSRESIRFGRPWPARTDEKTCFLFQHFVCFVYVRRCVLAHTVALYMRTHTERGPYGCVRSNR